MAPVILHFEKGTSWMLRWTRSFRPFLLVLLVPMEAWRINNPVPPRQLTNFPLLLPSLPLTFKSIREHAVFNIFYEGEASRLPS